MASVAGTSPERGAAPRPAEPARGAAGRPHASSAGPLPPLRPARRPPSGRGSPSARVRYAPSSRSSARVAGTALTKRI